MHRWIAVALLVFANLLSTRALALESYAPFFDDSTEIIKKFVDEGYDLHPKLAAFDALNPKPGESDSSYYRNLCNYMADIGRVNACAVTVRIEFPNDGRSANTTRSLSVVIVRYDNNRMKGATINRVLNFKSHASLDFIHTFSKDGSLLEVYSRERFRAITILMQPEELFFKNPKSAMEYMAPKFQFSSEEKQTRNDTVTNGHKRLCRYMANFTPVTECSVIQRWGYLFGILTRSGAYIFTAVTVRYGENRVKGALMSRSANFTSVAMDRILIISTDDIQVYREGEAAQDFFTTVGF